MTRLPFIDNFHPVTNRNLGILARYLGVDPSRAEVAAAVADYVGMPEELRRQWALPALRCGLALAESGGGDPEEDYLRHCSRRRLRTDPLVGRWWAEVAQGAVRFLGQALSVTDEEQGDVDLGGISVDIIDEGPVVIPSLAWVVDLYVEVNQRQGGRSWVWDVGWLRGGGDLSHLQPWRRGQATSAEGAVLGAQTDLLLLVGACRAGLRDPFTHRLVSPGARASGVQRFGVGDLIEVLAEMFPDEQPAAIEEVFEGLPHVVDLQIRTLTAAVLDWAGVPLPPALGSGAEATASSLRFREDLAAQGLDLDPAVAHYLAGADAHPGPLTARERHRHGVFALRSLGDGAYIPAHLDDLPAYRRSLTGAWGAEGSSTPTVEV